MFSKGRLTDHKTRKCTVQWVHKYFHGRENLSESSLRNRIILKRSYVSPSDDTSPTEACVIVGSFDWLKNCIKLRLQKKKG